MSACPVRNAVSNAWPLVRKSVAAFISDNALSHGAAMAFHAATSLAPIMLIVVAIAGLAFGEEAARNALTDQFQALMGKQSADLLQSTIESAGKMSSGIVGTLVGLV